jgi:aminoglycoside phosphotransferase (APT) family kinase protein
MDHERSPHDADGPVVANLPDRTAIPSGADLINEVAAVRLLTELGELATDRLFDGSMVVTDHSRRSRCLIVRTGDQGWVLKQGGGSDTAEAVRFEARMYRVLARNGATLPVPRLIHADEPRSLLVTSMEDGLPMREAAGDTDEQQIWLAQKLGDVLARIHMVDDHADLPKLPPPPILAAFRPGLDSLRYRSSASLELIALLQQQEALCAELEVLTRLWRPIALSHNDIRSDNLLVDSAAQTLTVIDWELAGLGDPHWDLAGPLAEQLSWWLAEAKFWGNDTNAADDGAATLAPTHRFTLPYLGSYLNRAGAARIDLLVLLRWCAARLVQSAFEIAYQHPILTAMSRQTLQLAANIFARPAHAARWLFGLEVAHAS